MPASGQDAAALARQRGGVSPAEHSETDPAALPRTGTAALHADPPQGLLQNRGCRTAAGLGGLPLSAPVVKRDGYGQAIGFSNGRTSGVAAPDAGADGTGSGPLHRGAPSDAGRRTLPDGPRVVGTAEDQPPDAAGVSLLGRDPLLLRLRQGALPRVGYRTGAGRALFRLTMMAGPCRQTKDGPECSGPSLARRPVESRAELLRLSEVDGDGLAVVRPLSLVNFQIVRFRIVVEPGRDREFRLSVAGIVFAGQPRQRRVRTDIQRRQRIGGAVQPRQRRVFADIQRLQRIVGAGQPRQRHIRTDIQRRQLIAVAVQLCQRRVRAYIQRRQLIVVAGQLRQRLEILDSLQGCQGAGVFISSRNIQFGHCGDLFHILRRDILRVGNNTLFLQLLRKVRVEQGGEIRVVGCRCLGDGQPHALLPAGQIGVSRAGRCPVIAGGRQFDGLFAGRTARGRDGQPVGGGFGIVVHDREGPAGRGGKRDRCGPIFDGVKRIFGLLDGQGPGKGIAAIILLAAGEGKGGSKCQQVK